MPQSDTFYRSKLSELKSQLADGNIITIAGAGVTVAATANDSVANWIGLLEHGIRYCIENIPGTTEAWAIRQQMSLDEGDIEEMVSVAHHIETKLGGVKSGLFYAWLSTTIGCLEIKDERLPRTLSALPTRLFTTNYDDILEKVSGRAPIRWSNIHRVVEFLRAKIDGIFHLHGHWDEPGDVVLGVNYFTLISDEKKQSILRSTLLQNRFLFVGVGDGIRDPHFQGLLDWSNKIYDDSVYEHYILVRFSELAQIEAQNLKHVVAIPYGENYDDLPGFIEGLIPKIAPTQSLTDTSRRTHEFSITLQCDDDAIDRVKFEVLQTSLREASDDDNLVLLRLERGSLRITVRTTNEAAEKLSELAASGELLRRILLSLEGANPSALPTLERIEQCFRYVSSNLLDWPKTLDSGEWISRPEVESYLSTISAQTNSSTVLLGEPGSGKSAMLSRVAQDAVNLGFIVIAVKADFLSQNVSSLHKLQDEWNLPLPPDEAIRYLASHRKTLLLVDQIDALADIVDVRSARLNVVLDLIKLVSGTPNLHIIVSSREFEFNHDIRLSSISASVTKLELPPWSEVETILSGHKIEVEDWSPAFKEILRVPQHLKVMLGHFRRSSISTPFESYQHMLEALWSKAVLPFQRRQLIVDLLATDISSNESLWRPRAAYEASDVSAVRELIAEGILRTDVRGLQLGFSHQTMYSFARARAFTSGTLDLVTFVMESQGSLFMRPTLWNTLFYMRSADPTNYERCFRNLWSQRDLAKHVRYLLIDSVGQSSSPLPCEIEAIVESLANDNMMHRIFRSLAGNSDWLSPLLPVLPSLMNSTTDKIGPISYFLERIYPATYERVLDLIKSTWLLNKDYDFAVWRVIAHPDQRWTVNEFEVLSTILARSFIDPFYILDVASEVAELSPENAMDLVRIHFEFRLAGLNLIAQKPSAGTFDHDESGAKELKSLIEEAGSWHELVELAKNHPEKFLTSNWGWFTKILRTISSNNFRGVSYPTSYSPAFDLSREQLRTYYPIPEAFDTACQTFAEVDPNSFIEFVKSSSQLETMFVHRLIARSLLRVVSTKAIEALDYLLGDPRRLVLGDDRNMHNDTCDLIAALAPHVNSSKLADLEDYILGFKIYDVSDAGDPNHRRNLIRYNREHQLRLLSAIPSAFLSKRALSHIESEKVALIHYRDWDSFSSGWQYIPSPMNADQMLKASDSDILGLFHVLTDDTGSGHPTRPHQGGTVQAAREFGLFAKQAPSRAVSILRQLPTGKHDIVVGETLRALPDTDYPVHAIFELILDLSMKGLSSESYREDCAISLRGTLNKTNQLPESIVDLLESWLSEPWKRPSDVADAAVASDVSSREGSLLWTFGGMEILPNGTYYLMDVLSCEFIRRTPPLADRWLDLLEKHLSRQDRLSVWRTLCHHLQNLRLCEHGRASRFLDSLFNLYPSVLRSGNGIMLIANCIWWADAVLVKNWMNQLRDSDWPHGPQAYGELVFLGAGRDQKTVPKEIWDHLGPAENTALNSQIQKGLAYAAANLWIKSDFRFLATEVLTSLLMSSEPTVLVAALEVFRIANPLPLDRHTLRLMEALYHSTAFDSVKGHSFVVDRLAEYVLHKPVLVAQLAQKFVDSTKDQLSDARTSLFAAAPTLTNISLTLQRNPLTQQEGMTLFEDLLETHAYGAIEALRELDQVPLNNFFRKAKL